MCILVMKRGCRPFKTDSTPAKEGKFFECISGVKQYSAPLAGFLAACQNQQKFSRREFHVVGAEAVGRQVLISPIFSGFRIT